MKRVAIFVGAAAAGIVAVAMASSAGGVALGAGLESRSGHNGLSARGSAVSAPSTELRRVTRWLSDREPASQALKPRQGSFWMHPSREK